MARDANGGPCGMCRYFGEPDQFNFGPCLINAFGDGLPLHRRFKSKCEKFEYSKAKSKALRYAEKG